MVQQSHWQVQEAKQRFSELLRAVENEGPQIITRHGEDVAVIIDIEGYRRLTHRDYTFVDHIKAFPKMPETDGPDVFDEIEAERKLARSRPIDLGTFDDPGEPR